MNIISLLFVACVATSKEEEHKMDFIAFD